MRYDTILGYVKAATELFRLRNFPPPFLLDSKHSLAATILNNIKDEEDIAVQRAPLSPEMYAEILKLAKKSDFLSMEQCIADFSILGRYLGPRLAEYAQKSYIQTGRSPQIPKWKASHKSIMRKGYHLYGQARTYRPPRHNRKHQPTNEDESKVQSPEEPPKWRRERSTR
jgi:hypothetical protein